MQGKDPKSETAPAIVIVERRSQRQPDLSPAEVMKLVRKRSSAKRGSTDVSCDTDRAR